ncbi:TetR family transcriptional regulator [Yinghuangia sp. ASG 101]|nr:TetR family transcriptional regulator [Yinghuangia sp. ASG 101]UGQ15269.1 TetR family transcriptional regulator [Yinghuangia sp. ASG 101]
MRDVLSVLFGAETPPAAVPGPARPPGDRRRDVPLKGATRREQILRAALEVFAEPGTRGTLQEIANRVGVKQPSLLHYFASREELLLAVLRERGESGAAPVRAEDDPAAAVTAWVRHELDEPGLIRLLATLSASATDPEHPAHDYFADRGKAAHASLAAGLTRAQREHRVRDDERADDLARLLPAVVDGLRTQWLLDPSVDIAALVDTFLRMCADPGPPRD